MHIHLLGPSGSGTSSLGRALATSLRIPWFDTDEIFLEETNPPFTITRPLERRQAILQDINTRHESWIISGSMLQWGDFLRDTMDLIVYLYVDKETRIPRLVKREKERFGDRILPGHDMHDNHQNFIKWAESYETGGLDMRSRASEMEWIRKASCKVVKIENEISLEDEIQLVIDSL